MELELVPLVLGGLITLAGLGLIADGWLPDRPSDAVERRRRTRTERNRAGEVLLGLGVVALGAALLGRDVWRFGTIAVLCGVACIALGALLNRRYLYEALTFRGAARRGRSADRPLEPPAPTPEPPRRVR